MDGLMQICTHLLTGILKEVSARWQLDEKLDKIVILNNEFCIF